MAILSFRCHGVNINVLAFTRTVVPGFVLVIQKGSKTPAPVLLTVSLLFQQSPTFLIQWFPIAGREPSAMDGFLLFWAGESIISLELHTDSDILFS